MTLYTYQPIWRYGIFQIPAILTAVFLSLALLVNSLGWLSPSVSVNIALDLSSSTYDNVFNGPGTVMEAEIESVKRYVEKNASLPNPNLVSLSGFASNVVAIAPNFTSNSSEIATAIAQIVQPSIASGLGGGTNLNLAVEDGLTRLAEQRGRCKAMVVVTDGQANLDAEPLSKAIGSKVTLNFLIVSQNQAVPDNLSQYAKNTGGIALAVANPESLLSLLPGRMFEKVNLNPFVPLFLGLAWISFVWMLLLPIDRLLQKFNKNWAWSGNIAKYNAFFWTLATPAILGMLGLLSNIGGC